MWHDKVFSLSCFSSAFLYDYIKCSLFLCNIFFFCKLWSTSFVFLSFYTMFFVLINSSSILNLIVFWLTVFILTYTTLILTPFFGLLVTWLFGRTQYYFPTLFYIYLFMLYIEKRLSKTSKLNYAPDTHMIFLSYAYKNPVYIRMTVRLLFRRSWHKNIKATFNLHYAEN